MGTERVTALRRENAELRRHLALLLVESGRVKLDPRIPTKVITVTELAKRGENVFSAPVRPLTQQEADDIVSQWLTSPHPSP